MDNEFDYITDVYLNGQDELDQFQDADGTIGVGNDLTKGE